MHSKLRRVPATIAGSAASNGCCRRRVHGGFVARRASSSSRLRASASAPVLGLDRARIGGVDEGQRAGDVARPDRRGQRFDQAPEAIRCRGAASRDRRASSASSRFGAGQSRSAAPRGRRWRGRPPRWRAGSVISVEREAFAVGAQRIDRVLHRLRLVRLEPGAERQHASRQRCAGDERGVAEDVRLVGSRRPHHDICGSDMQQRVGAVALLAQRVDLVCRAGAAVVRRACACAPA